MAVSRQKLSFTLTVLALACAGRPGICAQSENAGTALLPDQSYVCQTWRVEDGLPQNSVLAIVQTQDGYVWLGTANGLARFDGVQFKRFGLADGLSSLYVRVLLEDREGGLWIGTVNGLSRLLNGRFTTWTTRDGLAGNVILALTEDREGAIWIGTNTGLSRWRNGAFETIGLQAGISARYVAALVADRQGAVWVSVNGVGLLRWDGGSFTTITNLPGPPLAFPARMLQDRAGRIWAGTVGRVFCLEGTVWKKYGPEDGVPEVGIISLAEGAGGTIWAGTFDQALFYLREGKVRRVAQGNGLSDTSILAIMEDREKNLWVGTRAGGLNRLKSRQVSMWCHTEDGVEVPPMSLAESPEGVLLMASQGRGVYRFESRGRMQFVREPLQSLQKSLPLGALLSARDGSLWWGSVSTLLQWKEGKLMPSSSSMAGLRGDSVRCLQEDRDHGLWIGTRDGRLLLLRDDVLTAFTNGLPGGMFTALAQQSDGTLWIGSYGGGLGRVKNGAGTVFGRGQGLRSDLIRALCLDSQATLWIGTEGGGLSCVTDGALRSFGVQQGIGDDTILQILEDNDGDLWLGTYRGIFHIFRRDLQALLAGRVSQLYPHMFSRTDGMLSEQCAVGFGTCLKTRDGRLCFSTDRGIAVIDPKAVARPDAAPRVLLEEMLVDGARQPSPSLRLPNDQTSRIPLLIPSGKQRFEFQYTGLHYSAPERVRFRYRLEGLDTDWIDAGAQRAANYSYLPPGSYRFHVAAHQGDGKWGEDHALVAFTLLPHYWQTWWFTVGLWLGGVGVVSGGVALVLRRRHKLRLQALERQRAIERERTRIARDMHDELGSRLTKAGMVAERLKRGLGESPQLGHQLQTLRDTLADITVTMDELVWTVNPRHDTLNGLANYLVRFTQEFFAGSPIQCVLDVPADLPAVPLPAAIRHHLFLAVKEALNNAAKHAAPTEVSVGVEFAAGRLLLQVSDNGTGFAAGDRPPGGRGLANMRDRLGAIGGHCEVKTNPGCGTRVRFELTLRP